MPKAVRFYQLGGPEVLRVEDIAPRKPGPDEVALQVSAAGLNRSDSRYFRGLYRQQTPEFPSGLGYEAFGTVTAVGPNVDRSLIGRHFGTLPGYSMNRYPALAEEAIVPAMHLAALPPSLSPVESAAVWMQYATAYGGLVEMAKVSPGDFVIITAASSSVGLASIQIVKAQGGTAIATTRSSIKKQGLKDLGADHVIATQEEDLVARVSEITEGKMARIAFDSVGGAYINTLSQAVATEGSIYFYGVAAGEPAYPMAAFGRGISLASYSLAQMRFPDRLARLKKYIYEHLEAGVLQPHVDKVFPLARVVEAYEYLESNQHAGKIVITM
jgi:NADPH:quinone reductase